MLWQPQEIRDPQLAGSINAVLCHAGAFCTKLYAKENKSLSVYFVSHSMPETAFLILANCLLATNKPPLQAMHDGGRLWWTHENKAVVTLLY